MKDTITGPLFQPKPLASGARLPVIVGGDAVDLQRERVARCVLVLDVAGLVHAPERDRVDALEAVVERAGVLLRGAAVDAVVASCRRPRGRGRRSSVTWTSPAYQPLSSGAGTVAEVLGAVRSILMPPTVVVRRVAGLVADRGARRERSLPSPSTVLSAGHRRRARERVAARPVDVTSPLYQPFAFGLVVGAPVSDGAVLSTLMPVDAGARLVARGVRRRAGRRSGSRPRRGSALRGRTRCRRARRRT